MTPKPIPPAFRIPAELLPAAALIRERYSCAGETMSSELHEIGLASDQADTVAVHWLIVQACEIAMASAIVDGRIPDPNRWQETTLATFNEVAKHYERATANLRAII